ncbi:hypothetical protein LOK49_LG14G01014 [Camellia lanceoleosa]|uniref:Uncharacterized protein n=1 Tax=Camellia lanceoleosa TaxID=1840588 RepID=A0ACC0F811_9ERIC|nr:hypothetical protein LOK49_LG14G01014 [Camellia lanceoleosa]
MTHHIKSFVASPPPPPRPTKRRPITWMLIET